MKGGNIQPEELLKQAFEQLKVEESAVLMKIDELYSELKEFQNLLEFKQRKIAAIEWVLNVEQGVASTKITAKDTFAIRSPRDIKDNIADILSVSNGEMHYKHIYDKLISRGIQIPGKDPLQNLLSYLSRDERFVRVDKGTYTLTDQALKEYNRIA